MRKDDKPNLLLNIACFLLPLACVAATFLALVVAEANRFVGVVLIYLFNPLTVFLQLAFIGAVAFFIFVIRSRKCALRHQAR